MRGGDGVEGEAGEAGGMVGGLVLEHVARREVGVADDVHLLHAVQLRQRVELGKEAVEQVRDLGRRHGAAHRGEADDVGEEDGRALLDDGLRPAALHDGLGDGPRERLAQRAARAPRLGRARRAVGGVGRHRDGAGADGGACGARCGAQAVLGVDAGGTQMGIVQYN